MWGWEKKTETEGGKTEGGDVYVESRPSRTLEANTDDGEDDTANIINYLVKIHLMLLKIHTVSTNICS